MKLRGLSISLGLVIALALVAVAQGSKPTLLTSKTAKGPIAENQEVKAESKNLIFVTASGNLECTTNIIKGELKKNNAKKDEGPITEEISTGEEKGGLCKTTTPLGPAEITVKNLPWTAVFTDKGINEVKGKKIAFISKFPEKGNVSCVFEASKVKSTFNIGGPTKISTKAQKFKAAKGNAAVCPKEGALTGEWNVTSDGEVVESELT